jgi:WD40 repeat protein
MKCVTSKRVIRAIRDAVHSVWYTGSNHLLVSGQYWSYRLDNLAGITLFLSEDGVLEGRTQGSRSTGYTAVHPTRPEYACTGHNSCTIHSLRNRDLPVVGRLRIGRKKVERLLYTSDGRSLIWGGQETTGLVRWDTADWNRTELAELDQAVCSLVLSPDGEMLLVGGWDGGVLLWDARHLRQVAEWQSPREPKDGRFPAVKAIRIAPDGRTLYAALSRKPYLRSFRLPGFTPVVPFPQEQEVHALALLPDGRTLVSGDDHGKITFWDGPNAIQIGKYHPEDGDYLVTDVARGKSRRETISGGAIYDLALHPDGTTLAAGDSLGYVHILVLRR